MPAASTSRPILQVVHRPGIIDLGWGHPDPQLLPVAAIRRAADRTLDRYGSHALEYGYAAGPGPLLDWLSARIEENEGRAPGPDEIMLTGGSSLGLDQLLTQLAGPGDTLLVESPTYHLAIRTMQDHRLNLVPVPSDENGLQVDALREILADLRRQGRAPRALYTVPTFNNPTGISLALDRRRALVQFGAESDLLIIEDDVYRDLSYDAPPPPSLWSLAPVGVVARLGSFSKSLAPGLRLGWMTAGQELISRFTLGGLLDSGGGINHLTAMIVATLCEEGDFDAQVSLFRRVYTERRDALAAALARHLPAACQLSRPGGGFFVWVVLPPDVDSATLLPRAEELGVSFVPGRVFHPDGLGSNTLRLAFTLYQPDELVRAAEALGRALA